MTLRIVVKTLLCYVGLHTWGVRHLGATTHKRKLYQVYQCKRCGKEFKERI